MEIEKEIRIQRQFIIDAVIVRVMKARKNEKHHQLMEDISRQISLFIPDDSMIMLRIESLIEREFIKRDDKDILKYVYLP